MDELCMRCVVFGKVQGVSFRVSTKEKAKKLAIKGWVRNLDDGKVEVFACGSRGKLEILYNWLLHGPLLAEIIKCSREDLPWEQYTEFQICR